MRALVQRVREATVRVGDQQAGAINQGLCVFVGVTHDDGPEECDSLVNKLLHLRIMDDENGVMNKSVIDNEGEILIVSQFTLYGDISKGRRPAWSAAASPEQAEPLIEKVVEGLKAGGAKVQTGKFQQYMLVDLTNDGPATLMIEI